MCSDAAQNLQNKSSNTAVSQTKSGIIYNIKATIRTREKIWAAGMGSHHLP
jgi:hypothetical protein